MVSTRHTQSLTNFRQRATETLARINKTGSAEILTVNGRARAVLLAPAIYDELTRNAELSADARNIQKSIEELADGKGRPAETAFDDIRGKLLAMKKKSPKRAVKK